MPPLPEDLTLGPDESVDRAQKLLDAGYPFQAHEVLEAAWKQAPPAERALWQGLAQLAVGLTHARRGNRPGAVSLIERGSRRVAVYAGDPPYGIGVQGLLEWSADALSRLQENSPAVELPAPRLR